MRFEWDRAKAETNLRKHRVSFETALRVFFDPFVLIEQDRVEDGEYRWQAIGAVDGHTVLIVAHVNREDDEAEEPVEVIRIISARKADLKERRRYEEDKR
ncbi:BrnT family toxin [Neorhizobium sp. NCHU2750]|uniref:BrnT family toxin n=1 Tax=Neorhizobium sp. NCHU2750 TaxID=1825976 RepID=UPI000E7071EC|nr:membrane protein [Neorhizobium sp. NCHU2750]